MIDSVAAAHVNTLVDFCAMRDVDDLTREAVESAAGGPVDVAVLYGGSILAGADVFARIATAGLARHYMIVGGQGHSTDVLRRALAGPDVDARSEASLFDQYLRDRHGIAVDLLEHESTNCGSNVRNTLTQLAAARLPHRRILIVQDASMQRRMDAGFRLHAPDVRIVNYAAHRTHIDLVDGEPAFANPPIGMWSPDRYVSLLMGEIPRLADDENGYGPRGRHFIAHVDVPTAVTDAYRALRAAGAGTPRAADDRWSDS
ncbi:hypothetical protein Aab01nite_10590 [Paractinoplanes abujensis]|uniref:DUF218 domain-containing protein n=1 Tax=Paractinoplanes abujensis TaxID=882441 RepID=A0A7W7G003_9ACTN|nr:ElyC/SanA/YdcF family protein [Actinoplanes abujensis]MBB4691117.1 hypothetical protein [Actinoplanes abujensis]GID17469.1 hypothetical protein Aab01nite_10590 [Actinoplanes abujensis]